MMPVLSFGVHRTVLESALEHCVGDLVRISDRTKGKGAGCTGTVQKITKVFTFVSPECTRGEVRAMHWFIKVIKKQQPNLSKLQGREEDAAKRAQDDLIEGRHVGENLKERDHFLLKEILHNQKVMLEKMHDLDVKQELLTIEARNLHTLVTDLQTNVEEIHQTIFQRLQEQVKTICCHLPMICRSMHGTDQKLAVIINKVGIGGTDDEFFSVTDVEEHHKTMSEFALA